jgi:hypothetical protein
MRMFLPMLFAMLPGILGAQTFSVPGDFTLLWNYGDDPRVSGFTVNINPGTPIDVPDPQARSVVLGLQAGTVYDISMTAYSPDLVSAESEVVRVYVGMPLSAPSGLTVSADVAPSVVSVMFTDEMPDGVHDDGVPWELGMKFSVVEDGSITALRHFQVDGDAYTHTGRLWAADGTLLATAMFTQGAPDNWAEVVLDVPVDVSAGAEYVVSVDANTLWPGTAGYLPPANGYLIPLDNMLGLELGAFPDTGGGMYTYFRDVVFER